MKKILTTLCLTCALLPASDVFVGPNGSPNASGTANDPIDLQTALNGALSPGSVVWMRGGTYKQTGNWTCWNGGSAANKALIKNYNSEHVRIDGGSSNNPIITGQCHDVVIWNVGNDPAGIEIFNSDTKRVSSQTLSFPTDIHRGPGYSTAQTYGVPYGLEFRHLAIHDTWGSFGVWNDATSAEIYGNVVYHDGWDAPDRGHGHGIYSQNDGTTQKRILANIMVGAFANGLQIYGTGDVNRNYDIEDNVAIDNGQLSKTSGYAAGFIIGDGDFAPRDITFKNNWAFFSPSKSGGEALFIGSGAGCQNVVISGNHFIAPSGRALYTYSSCMAGLKMSNNQFVGSLEGDGLSNFPQSNFPGNQFINAIPTGTVERFVVSSYNPNRAHVTIQNGWGYSTTIALHPPHPSFLATGDSYAIYDSQNITGAPIATGTFAGDHITAPVMNENSPVAATVGATPVAAKHSDRHILSYIVIRTNR